MSSSLALTLVLLAAPIPVFAAVRWRRALLFALPLLVVLNGLPLSVAGTTVRLDQLAACLLVIPLALSVIAGSRRLRTDETTWWLAALLVMNLLASVVNSPARAYSLLQCANLASAWVIYFLLINYLDTREELNAFFIRCLWAALVGSGIGILAFALALAGAPVGGAEASTMAAESLTRAYGAYGTMVEPNIFGSFTGAMFVLAVGLLLARSQDTISGATTRLTRVTASLCAIGVVLSFTRSAWIGVLVGLLVLLTLGRRIIGLRVARLAMPLAVGLLLVTALLLLPGTAGDFLRFKFINLVNLESRTATLRLLTYAMAVDQTLAHPFLGWGTFTFAPLVVQGTDFARFEGWRNIWITNFLLLALHDTGIIGGALWIGMLWSLLRRGILAARLFGDREPELAGRAVALTAMAFSLIIPFLATTGFSLGYPWMMLGVLGAHIRLSKDPTAT